MKKENLIQKLDEFFYAKETKEIIIIYASIVLVVGFLMLYVLLPQVEKYLKNQKNDFEKTKSVYQTLKVREKIINAQAVAFRKRMKELMFQKSALSMQKDFYDELASLLDFVEFNDYKWSEYVKRIVTTAKKEGLKVLEIDNKIYDSDKNIINKKMDIDIKLKGEYKNLLYFIYQYENTKDLIKIEAMEIDKNKNFKIKISLYGCEQ